MSGVSESLEIKPDCCEAKGLAAVIKPPEHGCGRKKAPARCPVQRRTFTYVRTSPLFLLPVDLDARRPPTGFLKSVFRKPVRKCLPVAEKLDKVALSSWCSYWSAEAPARDQDESSLPTTSPAPGPGATASKECVPTRGRTCGRRATQLTLHSGTRLDESQRLLPLYTSLTGSGREV